MTIWPHWRHHMSRYRMLLRMDEGDYSRDDIEETWMCHDLQTKSDVIVKWKPYCAVPRSVILNEIFVLIQLHHGNIVRISDVRETNEGFYLVSDSMSNLLCHTINEIKLYKIGSVKNLLYQTLRGLSYCHSQKILHRDLKPQSLLTDEGTRALKLTDFGYAINEDDGPLIEYPTEVTSPQYKAPELLLGMPYTSAIDVWTVGCIFVELLIVEPLFDGTNDAAVMTEIIRMLGLPCETDWPGVTSACLRVCEMETLPSEPIPNFLDVVTSLTHRAIPNFEPDGIDLLSKMLCVLPSKRITAEDALKHPYFENVPDRY